MASINDQTIKNEPSTTNEIKLEQWTTTNQQFTITKKEEDETFEQFYSEA